MTKQSSKKSAAFIAKEKRNVENAKAKREAAKVVDLADVNAAKINAMIEEKRNNEAPKTIPVSNQPEYTTDQCIHDILASTRDAEKAGAGLVVNLFANNEEWSLTALRSYFGAKQSQSVVDPKTGKKRRDASIPTRSKIATAFLSRNEEYKASVEALAAVKAEYKRIKKVKPVDHIKASLLSTQIENDAKPINAAYQKVHRAFQATYYCRVAGYINVRLGPSNQLLVTDANGEEKVFSETDVRKAGTEDLTKEGLVTPRAARGKNGNGEVKALSAVDATTAGPIVDALSEMLSNEEFKPPVTSNDTAVMTIESIAELALATMIKVTKEDIAKSVDLRSTISDIAVEINRLISTPVKKASKKAA
jgi:hypothetical protein